jgi:predicted PurR-regulated permease PerM
MGVNVVEIVYFTLAGIGLYFASDWILDRLETRRGSRFENRSIIFFVIILVLALVSFQLISLLQQH